MPKLQYVSAYIDKYMPPLITNVKPRAINFIITSHIKNSVILLANTIKQGSQSPRDLEVIITYLCHIFIHISVVKYKCAKHDQNLWNTCFHKQSSVYFNRGMDAKDQSENFWKCALCHKSLGVWLSISIYGGFIKEIVIALMQINNVKNKSP